MKTIVLSPEMIRRANNRQKLFRDRVEVINKEIDGKEKVIAAALRAGDSLLSPTTEAAVEEIARLRMQKDSVALELLMS